MLRLTDKTGPFFGMTYLGTILSKILEEEPLTQRQLAERCGITTTTVHAVIHGRPCSPETLKALCRYVSGNLRWRYEVLLAHLRDEAKRSGLDTGHLVIQYSDGVSLGDPALNESFGVTFNILAKQAQADPALKKLLDSLVEMGLRREAVPIDRAAKTAKERYST